LAEITRATGVIGEGVNLRLTAGLSASSQSRCEQQLSRQARGVTLVDNFVNKICAQQNKNWPKNHVLPERIRRVGSSA